MVCREILLEVYLPHYLLEADRFPGHTEKGELIHLAMGLFGVHVCAFLLTGHSMAVVAVFPGLQGSVNARKERQKQKQEDHELSHAPNLRPFVQSTGSFGLRRACVNQKGRFFVLPKYYAQITPIFRLVRRPFDVAIAALVGLQHAYNCVFGLADDQQYHD